MLIDGIEVVGTLPLDTTAAIGQMLELQQGILLTCFDSATYFFVAPPIIVGRDTLRASDTLRLHVVSVPIDTLHLNQFYGAKDVTSVPFAFNWILAVLALLAALLIGLAVMLWLKLRKLKPHTERIVVLPPPAAHEVALAALNSLHSSEAVFTDEAERHDHIVSTLRTYIKSRFAVDCNEKTSGQILHSLKVNKQDEALDHLTQALLATDIVRFAGQRTQTTEALTEAIAYVEATQEHLPPREPIVSERIEDEAKYKTRRNLWRTAFIATAIAALLTTAWLIKEIIPLL